MSSAGESVELPEIRRDEKNTSTNEITRFHERNWTIRARKNFDLFYEVIAAERRIMKYTNCLIPHPIYKSGNKMFE